MMLKTHSCCWVRNAWTSCNCIVCLVAESWCSRGPMTWVRPSFCKSLEISESSKSWTRAEAGENSLRFWGSNSCSMTLPSWKKLRSKRSKHRTSGWWWITEDTETRQRLMTIRNAFKQESIFDWRSKLTSSMSVNLSSMVGRPKKEKFLLSN